MEILRHLKAVVCSATTGDGETLHQRSLVPFKPLTNDPGTFEVRDGAWSDCVPSFVDSRVGKFEGGS